ncbi:MAG TPA: alpha/beta hydrolase [Bacteroidales bacterium]|nr:alpha/beta hydrolase [Bacteroidales bacterium]
MKRIAIILVLSLVTFSINFVSGQNRFGKKNAEGTWLGNLEANGVTLRIVFRLRLNDSDSLTAVMDSPDQNATNIPMGRVIQRNDSLKIYAPALMGYYKGSILSDSAITGVWTQRGVKYPMDIVKVSKPVRDNRPQEPRPPFPYSAEDVRFANKNANIFLAGTLTTPVGNGPFPAVILVTGSGPQNRDEALMGHKPFLVIADWLSRNGIAVLRFDDRGVGKSQGNYGTATTADLATDAEAAFLFLKGNPKINPGMIGIMGHSEGGLIAPMVAALNKDVAFIVSLAGPGVNGEQIILRQSADIGRLSGLSEGKIAENNEINRKLYEIVKGEKDDLIAEDKVTEAYRKILTDQKIPQDQVEDAVNKLQSSFGARVYPWFRYFISAEPSDFWKKVNCPVLAINGDKDLQVAADVNLPAIENALKSSGNKNIKTVRLQGLNHLFQHCTTGLPTEYGKIEETFSPEALKLITGWILDLKVSR